MLEETLSLASCVATVEQVLTKYGIDKGNNEDKVIYVGASFGAYVGFHILYELRPYFDAAILMDCGQNIGPGASFKARAGMWLLKNVSKSLSNKALVTAMLDATNKSKADYKLIESTFGAGIFFDQGFAQCKCLRAVAPAEYIPELVDLPVLFFNGGEDYRDSEKLRLELCKEKELSDLIVYEGGDHLFCHDSRFVDDLIQRMHAFATKVGRK